MATRVTILGATGSIGKSALDVVRRNPGQFEVVALTGHSNVELLMDQIEEFSPTAVAVTEPGGGEAIRQRYPKIDVYIGEGAIAQVAARETDVVLCAVVGAAGLDGILQAIDAGHRVAIANKEPLVMAGKLIMERARANNVSILPVDSEHNGVFQCLHGRAPEDIHKVYLTASGGPFYACPREELAKVTPSEATKHPTWDMGEKISVDSATLTNKGLEVIEAMWLFDLSLDQIDVVIHPQSIVHALVELTDGSIMAHMGVTDMRLPIQFALTWPNRVESPYARLDLTAMKDITFAAPDFGEFPCLALALDAARHGGTAPAVLNAANEEAVAAFRKGQIEFLQIAEVVRHVMEASDYQNNYDLESIMAADARSRELARTRANGVGAQS